MYPLWLQKKIKYNAHETYQENPERLSNNKTPERLNTRKTQKNQMTGKSRKIK
jgi:hypothetical protein